MTPADMRAVAATLRDIAPKVETDYGPGQVATYGLAWEGLEFAAGKLERLTAERNDYKADYLRRHKDAVDRFEECLRLKKEIERLVTALRRLENIYNTDRVAREIETIFDESLHPYSRSGDE